MQIAYRRKFSRGCRTCVDFGQSTPAEIRGVPICMLESGELLFGDGPGAVAVVFDFIYGKHTGRLVLDNGASRGCLKRAALNDKGAASPARYVSQRKKPPVKGGLSLAGVLGFRTNPRFARGHVAVSFTGDKVSRSNSHKLRLPGTSANEKNHP